MSMNYQWDNRGKLMRITNSMLPIDLFYSISQDCFYFKFFFFREKKNMSFVKLTSIYMVSPIPAPRHVYTIHVKNEKVAKMIKVR